MGVAFTRRVAGFDPGLVTTEAAAAAFFQNTLATQAAIDAGVAGAVYKIFLLVAYFGQQNPLLASR